MEDGQINAAAFLSIFIHTLLVPTLNVYPFLRGKTQGVHEFACRGANHGDAEFVRAVKQQHSMVALAQRE